MPIITGAIIGGASLIGGSQDRAAGRLGQWKNYQQQKEFAQNAIQWRTEDAQAAGIHPLFAMGAATQSFQPGFTTGSGAGDAIRGLGRGMARAREDWLQAQIENTKAKTAAIRSNATQDIVIPGITPQAQEIEKGRVTPFIKKAPEQSLNVKSPMTRVRIGSQKIWVPVEEMDEFMENPLAVGALTYIYHGNKNVDWGKVAKDYTGSKSVIETMKGNIRKHIPIKVRKKHLLKKFAKPADFGAMP